jgi:Family of unknown function (DUF5336)
MSYPSGAPGGYPGQPPQPNPGGPQQGGPYGGPPRRPGFTLALTPLRIVFLIVAGLSVLSLFLSFLDVQGGGCTGGYVNDCYSGTSFYNGAGWVPALLAVGGVLALLPVLPWRNRDFGWGLIVALVNVAVVLPILFDLWDIGDLGAGGFIVMFLAILQLAGAVVAYLMEINVLRFPARPAYQQPGGQYPGSGPFPPPPGGPQQGAPQQNFNQPTTYTQQGQYPGQQGGPQQAGPPPQQAKPTQFMQHPGQLSQPGPGTPPGGYDQN